MKSILDIELKSSFKYQMIFFVSALMHTIFFCMFLYNEMYGLMIANIASISFYLSGGVVSRKGNMEKHGSAWIMAAYAEITVHAALCTIWLGFEPCFYLYWIVALMVSAYVAYLACEKQTFLKMISAFSVITIITMGFCLVYLHFFDPIYTAGFDKVLDKNQTEFMRAVNVFFDTVVTLFFSGMFIMEIHTLIRKLNTANEKLNYSAMHDALTGLYNRRSLYKLYDEMKDKGHFCVIMGDIDNFKKINDTYGHGCGDEVLKNISAIINDTAAQNDIACRWGGEEFLLVVRGTKEECLERLKEMRNRILALRIEYNDIQIKVTMTFGFVDCLEILEHTELIDPSVNIDALVQIADTRLYYGKENGKNTIVSSNVENAELCG
ncbi:MAG: GGDEF domain-containing protein [Bacteroides sp.]|nr:GGDEF domain-containing protein [Bacteroides sp.]